MLLLGRWKCNSGCAEFIAKGLCRMFESGACKFGDKCRFILRRKRLSGVST